MKRFVLVALLLCSLALTALASDDFEFDDSSGDDKYVPSPVDSPSDAVDDSQGSDDEEDPKKEAPKKTPEKEKGAKSDKEKPATKDGDVLDNVVIEHSEIKPNELDRVARDYLGKSVNKVRDALFPDAHGVNGRLVNFKHPKLQKAGSIELKNLIDRGVLSYHKSQISISCDKTAQLHTQNSAVSDSLEGSADLSGIVTGSTGLSGNSNLGVDDSKSVISAGCTISVARAVYQPGLEALDIVKDYVNPVALEKWNSLPSVDDVDDVLMCGDLMKWIRYSNEFGTHGIRAVALGGKITLAAKVKNEYLTNESLMEIAMEIKTSLADIMDKTVTSALDAVVNPITESNTVKESVEEIAKKAKLLQDNEALSKILSKATGEVMKMLPLDVQAQIKAKHSTNKRWSQRSENVSYEYSMVGGDLSGGYPIYIDGDGDNFVPRFRKEGIIQWIKTLNSDSVQPVDIELGRNYIFFGGQDNTDKLKVATYEKAQDVYETFYRTVSTKKNIVNNLDSAMRHMQDALGEYLTATKMDKGALDDLKGNELDRFRVYAAAISKFVETSCQQAVDLGLIRRGIFNIYTDVKDISLKHCIDAAKAAQAHNFALSAFNAAAGKEVAAGTPVVGSLMHGEKMKSAGGVVTRVDRGFLKGDKDVYFSITVEKRTGSTFGSKKAGYNSIIEIREKTMFGGRPTRNNKVSKTIVVNDRVFGVIKGLSGNRPGFQIVSDEKTYSFQTDTPQEADAWCDALGTHAAHFRVPIHADLPPESVYSQYEVFGDFFLEPVIMAFGGLDGKVCKRSDTKELDGDDDDIDSIPVESLDDFLNGSGGSDLDLEELSALQEEESEQGYADLYKPNGIVELPPHNKREEQRVVDTSSIPEHIRAQLAVAPAGMEVTLGELCDTIFYGVESGAIPEPKHPDEVIVEKPAIHEEPLASENRIADEIPHGKPINGDTSMETEVNMEKSTGIPPKHDDLMAAAVEQGSSHAVDEKPVEVVHDLRDGAGEEVSASGNVALKKILAKPTANKGAKMVPAEVVHEK